MFSRSRYSFVIPVVAFLLGSCGSKSGRPAAPAAAASRDDIVFVLNGYYDALTRDNNPGLAHYFWSDAKVVVTDSSSTPPTTRAITVGEFTKPYVRSVNETHWVTIQQRVRYRSHVADACAHIAAEREATWTNRVNPGKDNEHPMRFIRNRVSIDSVTLENRGGTWKIAELKTYEGIFPPRKRR